MIINCMFDTDFTIKQFTHTFMHKYIYDADCDTYLCYIYGILRRVIII